MISLRVVWAVFLRYVYLLKQDLNFILPGFYWPLLDIIVWGFLGTWISQSAAVGFDNYKTVALLGVLLWQIVGRGCIYMFVTFTEELYSQNVINLFSMPMRLIEWILGILLFSVTALVGITLFCMFFVWMLYDVSMYDIVRIYALCFLPLFIASIWIGFVCLQAVVLMGKRAMEMGFILIWFLLPFSGAYYPTDVLPAWGQALSLFLPVSYVFQGMRLHLMHGQNIMPFLVKGCMLSTVYAICSMCMFVWVFNYSKQKGLARLTD